MYIVLITALKMAFSTKTLKTKELEALIMTPKKQKP